MSSGTQWLERLNSATSYRDLQAVFSQMSSDARSSNNAAELAASIDEAIRRIEQERSRDHSAMDATANDYEAFKQEQSGVIGWFKRKLPFTETRKQELQHRQSINEQRAEILADNFVIARAQMLKEQILPAPSRRLGNRPSDWRSQFAQHESILGIHEYGDLAGELGRELQNSQVFLEAVRADVEAFAEAVFADKDDCKQRDHDLLAARDELKVVHDELQDKTALRKSALRRLGQLINGELAANDPHYRTTLYRIDRLSSVKELFAQAAKALDEYRAILKKAHGKLEELESFPKQREVAESALRKLRQDSDEAEIRRNRSVADFQQPSSAYDAALRESQQAKAAADASKRLYDAYLAGQNQGRAEVSGPDDFEASSAVATEYERLKSLATQSEDNLRRVAPLYETAKRMVDKATQEADSIRKKIEMQSKALASLADKENALRAEVSQQRESLFRVEPHLRSLLGSLEQSLESLDWSEIFRQIQSVSQDMIAWLPASTGVFPPPTAWPTTHTTSSTAFDSTTIQRKSDLGNRLAPSFQAAKKQVDDDHARQVSARKDAFQRRCQLLLDSNVAHEIVLDQ